MILDPSCVKAILKAYEELPLDNECTDLSLSDFTEDQLYYHQILLAEDGYLICKNISNSSDPHRLLPVRLTMKGHEFLNASRNSQAWKEVRSYLSKTGGFVMSTALDLLKEYIKSHYLP